MHGGRKERSPERGASCAVTEDGFHWPPEGERLYLREPRIVHNPGRPGDVPHSLADITKARQLLGYEPTVEFEEGVRRTVEWLKTESPKYFGPLKGA